MPIPSFQLNILERICDVLADTSTGFTGGEIGKLLRRLSIADPQPQMTKSHRLYEALRQRHAAPKSQSCRNSLSRFSTAFSIYAGLPPQSGLPLPTQFLR
jgi:hypothetical protein